MANETPQQIADQAARAGFTGSGLSNIVAIVMAESSGNASATHVNNNGSTDYGLAQINSIHGVSQASMMDPAANLAEAYKLSNNGTNFSPWVTYNTGAYKQFLGTATGATSGIGQAAGTPGSDAPGGAATGTAPGSPTTTNPNDPFGTTPGAGGNSNNPLGNGAPNAQNTGAGGITIDLVPGLKDLVTELTKDTTAIGGAMSAIGTFLQKLLWFTYPSSWVRIFAGGLGAVLLFFGLHYLGKEIKA